MKKGELISVARELVFRNFYGALATQGEYPFASLVRYSLDSKGQPVLLLSRIAEHSRNLQKTNRVSLLAIDNNENNIQESARISLLGKLIKLADASKTYEECLHSHFAFFPETRDYFENLDFDLYQLEVDSCRYIGGFAAAHTFSGEDYAQANSLSWQERKAILLHMNQDHQEALVHYCNTHQLALDGNAPDLVWIDSAGFQLRIAKRIHRLPFIRPVNNRTAAREVFVEMAGLKQAGKSKQASRSRKV